MINTIMSRIVLRWHKEALTLIFSDQTSHDTLAGNMLYEYILFAPT